MFGFDQRERLLREENWTANGLAQELYAMFSPDVPSNTLSTVTITPPTGSTVAPITIGNVPDGGTVFNITHQDGSAAGSIGIGPDGLTFTDPNGNTSPVGSGGGGGGVPVWG